MDAQIDKLRLDIETNINVEPDKIDRITQSLRQLQEVMQGNWDKLDDVVDKINKLSAINQVSFSQFNSNLQSATNSISPLQDNIGRLANNSNAFSGELKRLTPEIDFAGKSAERASGTFDKLVLSIKRITFYRVVRRIIQLIGKALVEGIREYARYDDATNETMSNIMNVGIALRNVFGVTLSTLLQALEPLIVGIGDSIIESLNAINKFLATISGADYYDKVIKGSDDYRESLEKTNKQLLNFDKFNVLQEKQKASPFETIRIDLENMDTLTAFTDLISELPTLIKVVGGALLALKLVDVVKNIGALAASLSPLGLIIGSIVALLGYGYATNEDFRVSINNLVKTVLPALSTILVALSPIFITMANSIDSIIPSITDLVNTVTPLIDELLQGAMPIITDLIKSLLPLLPVLIKSIGTQFSLILKINTALLPLAQKILPIIFDIIQQLLPIILEIVNLLLPLIESLIPIISTLADLLILILPVVKFIVEIAVSGFKIITTAGQAFIPILTFIITVLSAIINTFTTLISGVSNGFDDLGTKIKNIWSGIGNAFITMINAVIRAFETIVNGIVDGMNLLIKGFNIIPGVNIGLIGHVNWQIPKLQYYAQGGVVPNTRGGNTFVMNEHGVPEALTRNDKNQIEVQTMSSMTDSSYLGTLRALRQYSAETSYNGASSLSAETTATATISGDILLETIIMEAKRKGLQFEKIGI